ncbi:Glucose-induced degradation protein 8 [Tetrabaena socialis]|uniref:Glucose-induced degradation protein 8 n=1 Tax=Tetrabaena socialis TaxID=47790 RepID=A0A2J8A1S2_9CHLO|nr:Glucose-induced degradation protein 8 [Tetrabaena socialis]|eukprot:PNH06445.1 Glucose-induced degradation protein 8 [Tetrabaena socialis]
MTCEVLRSLKNARQAAHLGQVTLTRRPRFSRRSSWSGQVEEAVRFAQVTLSSVRGRSAGELERTLQDVVALAAYQNPEASPLAHLMGRAQREGVADSVNAAVLAAASCAGPAGPACWPAGKGASAGGMPEEEAAALPLRPAVLEGGVGPAAGLRPLSRVEALLQQLVAAQGALHEANGGQGGAFGLREHMLGPAA